MTRPPAAEIPRQVLKPRLKGRKAAAAPAAASAVDLALSVPRASEGALRPPGAALLAAEAPAAGSPAASLDAGQDAAAEEVQRLAVQHVARLVAAGCAGWRREAPAVRSC